ncbi:hypothetical protein [Streptomyces sp. NPDC007100]|uniref:hypothetical protein n=1 Tax=Streptomyces sp. NPDC007100 TaxID=3155602 RepID=UPI0033F76F7B
MARTSSTIHGYTAVPQNVGGGGLGSAEGPFHVGSEAWNDYQDVVGYREGFGVRFIGKAGSKVFFHFAVPTQPWYQPGTGSGTRTQLDQVFAMYRTTGTTRITAVHVWDGARAEFKLISSITQGQGVFDGSNDQTQPANHPKLLEGANLWRVQREDIHYAVSISLLVDFGSQDASQIRFSMAGADFVTP